MIIKGIVKKVDEDCFPQPLMTFPLLNPLVRASTIVLYNRNVMSITYILFNSRHVKKGDEVNFNKIFCLNQYT